MTTEQETMYALGRLFAQIELSGVLSNEEQPRQYERLCMDPTHALAPLVQRMMARGKGDEIAEMMQLLPTDLPSHVSEIAQGDFGLGYWQQKGHVLNGYELPPERRKAGRPRVYDEPRQLVQLMLATELVDQIDARAGYGQRTAFIERAIRAALATEEAPS